MTMCFESSRIKKKEEEEEEATRPIREIKQKGLQS